MSDSEFFEKLGTAKPEAGNRPIHGLVDSEESLISLNDKLGKDSSGEQRWASSDKTFWGVSSTYNKIPSGIYRCGTAQGIGPILLRHIVETDDLMVLPDNDIMGILDEFDLFWSKEKEFKKRGFTCKRGFLFWGPPGSGKTSCVNLLIKKLVEEKNGIILFVDDPQRASACLQMLRSIEEKRPIVIVMEDLDALVEKYGENEYLSMLDGEAQIDYIVYIATTNYPERLDKRFLDRPSRFDTLKKILMPKPEARKFFLKNKEPSFTEEELNEWVSKTENYSVAHLKELIISVKCFGKNLDDVIKRLNKMMEKQPKSSDADKDELSFGFGAKR